MKTYLESDNLLIKEFLLEYNIRGYSPETIRSYRSTLNMFYKHVQTPLERVNVVQIKEYILVIKDRIKACTVNRHITNMKVFYNWLIEEDMIIKNPVDKVKYLPEQKRMIKTFNDTHMKELLNFYKGKTYLDVRNRTLIVLLCETGIRNSELRNLTLDDIQGDSIRIIGKGSKIRYVPISVYLQKQLMKYIRVRQEYTGRKGYNTSYLFVSTMGNMMSIKQPLNVIHRACEGLGITDVKGFTHNVRRYFAQSMLNNVDVYTLSRLMGHNDISTTQRYLNSTDDKIILERGMNSPMSRLK